MVENGSTAVTNKSTVKDHIFDRRTSVPVFLVAFAPVGVVTVDRCLVAAAFIVGRSSECDLPVLDDKMSKRHFQITRTQEGFWLEDMGSTNGTFLDGKRVTRKQQLFSSGLIRSGRSVFVFYENAAEFLEPSAGGDFGIVGRFHSGPLIKQLREAAASSRHLLIVGSSGSGKEVAARALAKLMGDPHRPLSLLAYNAAQFANEDEAKSTLFGVERRVFSNVDARQGLIEQADQGVLFLDEIHNLSEGVQRSLLRVIEDGKTSRIGETKQREVAARFIFTSNAEGATHGLAHDLFSRLRLVRMPSLAERSADIPSIFENVLRQSLARSAIAADTVIPLLTGDHYEALCLDGLVKGNVRELIDLADRLTTRITSGSDPIHAVTSVFTERFSDGPVAERVSEDRSESEDVTRSHYQKNKQHIIRAIQECEGNLSAAERLLRARDISCSRRWLAIYCNKWGIRRKTSL